MRVQPSVLSPHVTELSKLRPVTRRVTRMTPGSERNGSKQAEGSHPGLTLPQGREENPAAPRGGGRHSTEPGVRPETYRPRPSEHANPSRREHSTATNFLEDSHRWENGKIPILRVTSG